MLLMAPSCKKDTQLDDDKDKIKAFLAERNIETTEYKNIFYYTITEGDGAQCQPGDRVACKYILTTLSNPDVIVDQQTKKAWECSLPTTVPDPYFDMITGFQIALTCLREGQRCRFYMPSTLCYGDINFQGEENCCLIYEIELCEILSNGNKH